MSSQMSRNTIEEYLSRGLNMGLAVEGETTYTRSFKVMVKRDGFVFIPQLPSTILLNEKLNRKIFEISSSLLFPYFTVHQEGNLHFIKVDSSDIGTSRGLFYPWTKGVSERLIVSKNEVGLTASGELPIMKNYNIPFEELMHIGISGTSGSGKSYFLVYLLESLIKTSEILVIDPKIDLPAKWAIKNDVELISHFGNKSNNTFVAEITERLSESLELIYQRQKSRFIDENVNYKDVFIVIDELLALTSGISKAIKDNFLAVLGQIALLGRSSNVHLVLCSQRFEAQSIPVAIREQLNVLVQLGTINSRTTQFLFPDLDAGSGYVIPSGLGTGLIQVINGKKNPHVTPLLTPTVKEGGL